MEKELCDLKVHINGQHTFFLHQRAICSYSAKLKKIVSKQEKKRRSLKNIITEIKIMDLPNGPNAFEMVSRFCYSHGKFPISPSNICALHSSAILLEMNDLLNQAETFLDGLFYWTWDDLLTCLKTCEPFFRIADSSGLLQKLISSLLSKISDNSESPLTFPYSPSPSSSPDTSANKTADSIKNSFMKEWWFDDLSILAPNMISKVLKALGAYGNDNKNLILTRFLLHYLKKRRTAAERSECGGLAETAVHGVVLMGRTAFSCRGLFWVLRIVSGFEVGKECRDKLESVIGLSLDQAKLDDLLISAGKGEGVYDVSLVLRLVRVFVVEEEGGVQLEKMKRLGRLLDKYLGEISPDQSLKVSKFLAVAESLPDSARDCFDGVYRALEIYLESHPKLPSEDRSRLCRCLNFEKLTLEACKDLAKNPKIPPASAIQAMVSQQSKHNKSISVSSSDSNNTPRRAAKCSSDENDTAASSSSQVSDEKEELKLNLQKMQNRVVELEKVCLEMRSQMSKMFEGRAIISKGAHQGRGMTKLC